MEHLRNSEFALWIFFKTLHSEGAQEVHEH